MTEQAQRGRPRKEEQPEDRRERRRKDGALENAGMRLTIPEWVLEKYPETEYRLAWITDDGARVQQKHNQDWDPVGGIEPVPGAFDRHGNPVKQVLHVKRADWDAADKHKLEIRRREIEDQAQRGKVSSKSDAGDALDDRTTYADASNRLR